MLLLKGKKLKFKTGLFLLMSVAVMACNLNSEGMMAVQKIELASIVDDAEKFKPFGFESADNNSILSKDQIGNIIWQELGDGQVLMGGPSNLKVVKGFENVGSSTSKVNEGNAAVNMTNNIIYGYNNESYDNSNTLLGHSNAANESNNFIAGNDNTGDVGDGIIIGKGNFVETYDTIVVGKNIRAVTDGDHFGQAARSIISANQFDAVSGQFTAGHRFPASATSWNKLIIKSGKDGITINTIKPGFISLTAHVGYMSTDGGSTYAGQRKITGMFKWSAGGSVLNVLQSEAQQGGVVGVPLSVRFNTNINDIYVEIDLTNQSSEISVVADVKFVSSTRNP